MATRVNDEEECICGSGRNYKECHYIILSKHNWRALKTKEAIVEIQNISKEIKDFYAKNIQSLEKKIIYTIDEAKETNGIPSHNMRCATDEKGFHVIIFTNDNIGKAKDSIIAHEYTHILLQEGKFPTILPKKPEVTSIANY